ncbi:MAG: GFA family protein [Candidatus Latescibacterota bacterium]
MTHSTTIDGGCYCGAIRYQAHAAPRVTSVCYCANCRRAAGAQSVAWVTFAAEAFAFVRGTPARYRTDTAAWRTFCPTCGTSLTYASDHRPQEIDVTTGSLDRPEEFAPTLRVFADEKLPWDVTPPGAEAV